MVKVRSSTAEEEGTFEDVQDIVESGEVKEGDPTELAEHILSGKEVVLSDQVREFMKENNITEDEFIANLIKEGGRLT